jgi:[acyl-carrier-protein] S-malonyltransferase
MDIVLLFPGQGSQKPGMGRDLAEAFPAARDAFSAVDEALATPLSRLCFDGPADDLTLTHNAQPALLAHGAAAWAVAREALTPHVRAAAGHSLGEFTAYHAAGALTLPTAARLVRRRGELMYEAGTARPGAMAAILGDTTTPIETLCEQASREGGLVVPANYNSPGQVVLSGEVGGVERAMALAKAAGAKRAMRLNVSGAFHSPLMEPAAGGLREALASAALSDARVPVYANVTAAPVTAAGTAETLLLRQLTSPVDWTGVVRALARDYPGALFVEMGPGTVLAGLVKKIAPDAQTVPCGTAADVESLLQRVSECAST